MNLKRSPVAIIAAIFITVISLSSVFFNLAQSLGEPQVQAQLELYQTNLILNVAELGEIDASSEINQEIKQLTTSLIGSDPYQVAANQYQKTLDLTEKSLENLQNQTNELINRNSETPRKLLQQTIEQNQILADDLRLKLGIIYAVQNKLDLANNYWAKVTDQSSQNILLNIWQGDANESNQSVEAIKNQYDGWFETVNLAQLYQVNNNQVELQKIKELQQNFAQKALYKLLSLSLIPLLGGVIGIILLLFLVIQLILKKEQAILASNTEQSWEIPWNGETIWQVLVVGFFFISQIALPILISISGFNASGLGIRGKVLYVLVTYLLMAGAGLAVLYFSLKPFFPLPQSLFQLHNKNWFLWAIGGYLTAIPLVFLVSFLNQQIWAGKGGSNPLLLLTLQSQDQFALFILFITASIAAPIFEEIIFRGFLLPSLTRYLSVGNAIVISGLLFAIAHLSLAEILPLMTLGIILGIVYTRSRSLLASMMVHSLWNSGTLFTLFVLGSGS
jgi:membrane protease YdiL (CAAX protease family)